MKKILRTIAFLTIATLIFSTTLLVNLFYWATNSEFYEHVQLQNKVSSVVKLSQQQINTINKRIIKYLTLRLNNLNIKYTVNGKITHIFNAKELTHMQDVKKLFIYGYAFVAVASLIIAIIIIKLLLNKSLKNLIKITVVTPFSLIIISVLVISIVLLNFNFWFTIFHKIIFTNNSWLLDPQTDILIQIMPLNFFISMFTHIVMTSIVSLGIITILGFCTTKLLKKMVTK